MELKLITDRIEKLAGTEEFILAVRDGEKTHIVLADDLDTNLVLINQLISEVEEEFNLTFDQLAKRLSEILHDED